MPHLRPADVTFLQLHNTVFCVSCELIGYNNSEHCLACGSAALLSLSRMLGGSLRHENQARLIDDEQIDRVVGKILDRSQSQPATIAVSRSSRNGVKNGAIACRTLPHRIPAVQPAMSWVVERACIVTRADGAALALSRQEKLLCHASAGNAPDLGVELELHRGISGLCARTAISWRCDSSESDPYVDRARCLQLGAQSVVAAPLAHLNRVLGVLEVFSAQKSAFSDRHVASVQLLANLLVLAMTRDGAMPAFLVEQPIYPAAC